LAGYPLALGDFTHQVRTPANKMPPFDAAAVSNAQMADIFAFVKSLPAGGAAPAAGSAARPATVAAQAPAAPVALGPGNVQNGARIYVAYGCYQCHGRAAQGAPATGPRLGPNPISVEAMIHELRHPNEMPPFTEKVVTDAEINDIHAFLATLPQPPNPNSIPLLSK
jgi:cytochrome c553